jgi:hypothetical protein
MRPDSVIGSAKPEKRRRLLGGVLFGPSFANRIREICKKPLGGPVVNLHRPRHDWVRRLLLLEPSSCAARKILPTLFTARPEPAKHQLTRMHPLGYNIVGGHRPRFDPNEFVRSSGAPNTFSKREPRNRTQGNSVAVIPVSFVGPELEPRGANTTRNSSLLKTSVTKVLSSAIYIGSEAVTGHSAHNGTDATVSLQLKSRFPARPD